MRKLREMLSPQKGSDECQRKSFIKKWLLCQWPHRHVKHGKDLKEFI